MASPPILTPTGTTGWNFTKTAKTIEAATYQEMVMVPLIEEAERLYGGLTIRKAARVAGTVLAQGADGDVLVPVNPIGTPVALAPVGNYVAIYWNENEDAQTDVDIEPQSVKAGTSALAELTDQSVLALVASLTNFMSAAAMTTAIWYQAHARLMGFTNGMAAKQQVHAVFTHKQYPVLGQIDVFSNAAVRGGSETPYANGIWTKGDGVKLHITTVVANDGAGDHNVMFLPSAFKVSWNRRSQIKKQEIGLQNRVILFNNLGSGIVHDSRAIDIRITATGL